MEAVDGPTGVIWQLQARADPGKGGLSRTGAPTPKHPDTRSENTQLNTVLRISVFSKLHGCETY